MHEDRPYPDEEPTPEELRGTLRQAVDHMRQQPVPVQALRAALAFALDLEVPTMKRRSWPRIALFAAGVAAAAVLFVLPYLIQPPGEEVRSLQVAQGDTPRSMVTGKERDRVFFGAEMAVEPGKDVQESADHEARPAPVPALGVPPGAAPGGMGGGGRPYSSGNGASSSPPAPYAGSPPTSGTYSPLPFPSRGEAKPAAPAARPERLEEQFRGGEGKGERGTANGSVGGRGQGVNGVPRDAVPMQEELEVPMGSRQGQSLRRHLDELQRKIHQTPNGLTDVGKKLSGALQ